MRFGISTHLYHDEKLDRTHLAQVAAYGFDAIELFATRSHFDYHDERAVDALGEWLADTRLTLDSVHAPITDHFGAGDVWAPTFSTATNDGARRQAAIDETGSALQVARRIPFKFLVVHLGVPESRNTPRENNRAAAARSAQEICRLAEPLGVRVAFEVIPNALSTPGALVELLERDLDARGAGVCLDFGHAFLGGDVLDAIDTVSEHVIATHVHDNHRRSDEHLVPFLGAINWDTALMSMQKIGYDGTYLMELAKTGPPSAILEEARRARARFENSVAY